MRKILFILLIIPTVLQAGRPKQDTLYINDMSGNDTIIWLSRSLLNFNGSIRVEFEYTTFTADNAYIKLVSRSIPDGAALYYNVGASDTDTAYILNVTENTDNYTGKCGVRFEREIFLAEEFGFYFNKGSVTNDTLIYNYRKQ